MSRIGWNEQFESRKRDHIRIALDPKAQAIGASGLDRVELIHEALPDLNLEEVSLGTDLWGISLRSPLFVSSMTAGHSDGQKLNEILAEACAERGWAMGVGSQRRELHDEEATKEWAEIRKRAPNVTLMGNIGVSQLIQTPVSAIEKIAEQLGAAAMIVHANPLQECLQPEGSPQFRGSIEAIRRLCQSLSIPIVVKETGCGFSRETLARLQDSGVRAVDVSGLGGTHWGRVEGHRSEPASQLFRVAETFANWGISTVDSLLAASSLNPDYEIWASGGVRSGLDAAKLFAMGARKVGLAKPLMEAALLGTGEVLQLMEKLEFELKVAMFCTGCAGIHQLQEKRVWRLK